MGISVALHVLEAHFDRVLRGTTYACGWRTELKTAPQCDSDEVCFEFLAALLIHGSGCLASRLLTSEGFASYRQAIESAAFLPDSSHEWIESDLSELKEEIEDLDPIELATEHRSVGIGIKNTLLKVVEYYEFWNCNPKKQGQLLAAVSHCAATSVSATAYEYFLAKDDIDPVVFALRAVKYAYAWQTRIYLYIRKNPELHLGSCLEDEESE
jgi:hypothetical protein